MHSRARAHSQRTRTHTHVRATLSLPHIAPLLQPLFNTLPPPGKSAKDLQYSDGFTGNKKLYNAKLNVGGKVDAARRGGADMDGRRNLENDSFFAEGNDGFGASRA